MVVNQKMIYTSSGHTGWPDVDVIEANIVRFFPPGLMGLTDIFGVTMWVFRISLLIFS